MVDTMLSLFENCRLPISFSYNGKAQDGKEGGFVLQACAEETQDGKIVKTYSYIHLESKTIFNALVTVYPKYRAIEWKLTLQATEDTKIISNLRYDVVVAGKNGVLLGNRGDKDAENAEYVSEFSEYEIDLTASDAFFDSKDGRPTHENFPYFRLETDECKTFAVMSWQGTWYAGFQQKESGVAISCGQTGVNTRFYKGESFVMPLFLLMEYESDPVNTWRKFFIEHNMAQVDGGVVKPWFAGWNGQCDNLTSEVVRRAKQRFDENGIDIDFWWFDAGIGTDGTGPHNPRQQWWHGCNFEINYQDFPDGLDGFGKELTAAGKKLLMWFEPEVVRTPPAEMDGFYAYHPDFKKEWFVGLYQYEWAGQILSAHLLNLGNPECLAWLENRIFSVMDETHARIYRQDFNIPPASVFQKADAEDRKGMSENVYCVGYLKLLADIQARYPGILMDSCASGGGRLDLETMRLMFPLHYSDYQDVHPGEPETRLYMTQIISRWFPYYKNCIASSSFGSSYARRSAFGPLLMSGFSTAEQPTADYATVKSLVDEWRVINRAFLGDYYELEHPTRNKTDVKAYMLFDKAQEFGFALVAIPGEYASQEYVVQPKGLTPEVNYTVYDFETKESFTASGAALLKGFAIKVASSTAHLFTFTGEK